MGFGALEPFQQIIVIAIIGIFIYGLSQGGKGKGKGGSSGSSSNGGA
ncbi:hypothetical protein [uncultured Clostridium sp.]|nr:hypothetical protein [uncultured Clostridium sp.]